MYLRVSVALIEGAIVQITAEIWFHPLLFIKLKTSRNDSVSKIPELSFQPTVSSQFGSPGFLKFSNFVHSFVTLSAPWSVLTARPVILEIIVDFPVPVVPTTGITLFILQNGHLPKFFLIFIENNDCLTDPITL